MKKTTELSGHVFEVSSGSVIYLGENRLKQFTLNGYKYVSVKGRPIPVHRIVAKAFCAIPDGCQIETLQVDHIDSNKLNNRPSNLRWVTRKRNNSTKHARTLKRVNHKCVQHFDEWLKCSDGLVFVNYNDAAEYYGVTRQAVIHSCRTDRKRCKRQFTWISRDSVDDNLNASLRKREAYRHLPKGGAV